MKRRKESNSEEEKFTAPKTILIFIYRLKIKEISVNKAIETIGHSAGTYYRIMAEIEKVHINQP